MAKRKTPSGPRTRTTAKSAPTPAPPAQDVPNAAASASPEAVDPQVAGAVAEEVVEEEEESHEDNIREQLSRITAPPELDSPENRKRWKLEVLAHKRGPYLVELNVQYVSALPGAARDFLALFDEVCGGLATADGLPVPDPPARVGKSYFRCNLRVKEWRKLIAEDERRAPQKAGTSGEVSRYRCIYRLWPDFPVKGHISRSVATIKADAALRSFDATGAQVVWAVIDSGVSGDHVHFGPAGPGHEHDHVLLHSSVKDLHRCFAPTFRKAGTLQILEDRLADPDTDPEKVVNREALVARHREWALRDDFGHGTHVAGIIAGRAPDDAEVVVLQREDRINEADLENDETARVKVTSARHIDAREVKRFHGVAQDCRILSLRVLDHKGEGRSSDLIRALEYIRETVNDNPKVLRVHGANLSVGYEFDPEMFACGQSPLCSEVNRLVQAGVVVVTAAGNTGYGTVNAQVRPTKVGLSNTINDPGNAELAITVGATHRESPHTYGVSYFSSKGPTGDGRVKPDIVAPGERIISCAAGAKLEKAREQLLVPEQPAGAAPAAQKVVAYYVEETGTSMAAPHVSGAIAAFLSIRREFMGRPLDVKRIFLESAIPLGRERYFEGHGLLDLMKAIQSV